MKKAILKDFVRIFCDYNEHYKSSIATIVPYPNMNVFGTLLQIDTEKVSKIENYKRRIFPYFKFVNVEVRELIGNTIIKNVSSQQRHSNKSKERSRRMK